MIIKENPAYFVTHSISLFTAKMTLGFVTYTIFMNEKKKFSIFDVSLKSELSFAKVIRISFLAHFISEIKSAT